MLSPIEKAVFDNGLQTIKEQSGKALIGDIRKAFDIAIRGGHEAIIFYLLHEGVSPPLTAVRWTFTQSALRHGSLQLC